MISFEEYRDNLGEEELKRIIGEDNYDYQFMELAEEWFLGAVTDMDSRKFIQYFLEKDNIEDFLENEGVHYSDRFYSQLKSDILDLYEDEIGEDYGEYVADEKNDEYLYNEWKMSR